jgi:hypothetical protein
MRIASTTVAACLLACLALGCQRGKEQAVVIQPGSMHNGGHAIPSDPFGSASAAYKALYDVTNAALASKWSGELESFAPWLEEQTVAVERALALLKALRVGPGDVYAVANGRIALVYEQIATALTRASGQAAAAGFDADWKDQEGRIWEEANAFWARCSRGCSTGGTHLDAWDLRCRAGQADSRAKLAP